MKNLKYISVIILTFAIAGCSTTKTITGPGKPLKHNKKESYKKYLGLGAAYFRKGIFDRAESSLKKSLQSKRTPEALNVLGLVYEEIHDNITAEKTYKQLLTEFPEFALGYSNYNIFLCKYNRTAQLNELAKKIAAKGGAMAAVGQIAAGDCMKSKGKIAQAKVYYKNALVYEPYSAGALIPLAEMNVKKGFMAEAKKQVDLVHNQIGYSAKSVHLSYLIEKELGNKPKEREMLRVLKTRYAGSREAQSVQ